MERKSGAIKEGYLVKKRQAQHRWKTRWFVLLEDRIDYYRKKDRETLVGSVSLVKAAVTYPVSGYEKRPGVFVVNTYAGRQLLLRAPTDDDRGVWVHAIGGVIRALEGVAQKESSEVVKKLSCKVNLSDVLGAMQDADAGVLRTYCTVDGVEYDNCFTGTMLVDWLLHWSFATTREEASNLATDLLGLAHLQVLQRAGTPKQSPKDVTFEDSQDVFYRFTLFCTQLQDFKQKRISKTGVTLPSDYEVYESSTGSSSSSVGELSEGDILERKKPSKPRVAKEGILMKRGHLRKRWKARRVILTDKPPSLAYYSKSKADVEPLKVLNLLEGDKILDVDNDADEFHGIAPKTRKKHCFCILRPKGAIVVFQAEDDHERKGWVQALLNVIPNAKSKSP